MSDTLLEVNDLALFRGQRCLFAGLNFTLSAGQVLQLVGDNGTGKTSLLRALCTLLPIETGAINWRGEALPGNRDAYLAELCYAGHADSIKLDLSPAENLDFYASLASGPVHSTAAALEQVALVAQRDLPCRLLSSGQRRRVSLARLLVSDATLWLLDEPLTALDVSGRTLVASLIAAHAKAGGAIIFTTHQPLELHGVSIDALDLNQLQTPNAVPDYS
ncbi:MAG: cytochrome c biogenesis heme-transporting ATPase CcmA [Pseudomonadota bacterium]